MMTNEYLSGDHTTAAIIKENGNLRLKIDMFISRVESLQRHVHMGHNPVTDWHDCIMISCRTSKQMIEAAGKPSLNTPKPVD